MIDNKWFCETDDQRKTWFFLNLYVSDENNITGWHGGYANPTKFLGEIRNKKNKESDIIRELLIHLHQCRKDRIILITDTSDALPILRTRILFQNIKEVSFYGLKHISIDEILNNYFQQIEFQNESNKVQFLWRLLQKIAPLLPRGVLL